jgi:ABC-2 type transport system permease protein
VLLRDPFTKSLFDNRRSLVGWAAAIVLVGAGYASFWPTIQTPEMSQALANYPKGLLEAFNYSDLTTAAGYLGSAVYGLLVPLLVAVFVIAAGARAVAGDEEAGTLDLLLAHPVSRQRLALQRFCALGIGLVVISALLWLALVALIGPAGFDGVGPGDLAAMSLHLALFGLFFGALAYGVGAATGSRAAALAVSAGVGVLGYLANSVFPQVDGLEWVRNLSPFGWLLGGRPLVNGIQWGHLLTLAVATAVLVVAGTWAFTRRDVAV